MRENGQIHKDWLTHVIKNLVAYKSSRVELNWRINQNASHPSEDSYEFKIYKI